MNNTQKDIKRRQKISKEKKITRNYIAGLATCAVLTGLMINSLTQ